MGEPRQRAPLTIEPGPRARILVERGFKAFDGHIALQLGVPSLVHDAHAATTEHAAEPVAVL